VIARDRESAGNNLQVLDYVTPKIEDGVLTFRSSHDALKEFTEVLQDIGMLEMLPALGWIFVTDSESFIQGRTETIMLLRKPSTLAITANEAVFSVAVYFFCARSRPGAVQEQTLPSDVASSCGMSGYGMQWWAEM
jgi:hypothetical protein